MGQASYIKGPGFPEDKSLNNIYILLMMSSPYDIIIVRYGQAKEDEN
jgi:hypothetical protein